MRRKSFRGAWLLVAWMALAPAVAWGQSGGPAPSYAPASPGLTSWLPLGSTRPEDGGFFAFAQATYFKTDNPLKSQVVAVRGFVDSDGSVSVANVGHGRIGSFFGSATPPFLVPGLISTRENGRVDQFFGSGQEALNVNQLTGQDSYTVGTEMGIGWKLGNGSSISLNWTYFGDVRYSAGATLSPKLGVLDQNLANTFLFADVHNIPPQFSGPDNKIQFPLPRTPPGGISPPIIQPSPQAAFGIWNGASIMTIDFIQRFQQYEVIYREPIFETETYRMNGLVGPRFAWIWERFAWRTTSIDAVGLSGPQDVGLYTNIVSNRMYGAVAGCEQEYYLGHGIVLQWKLEGAMFVDTVKVRAKYETGDRFAGLPENKKAKGIWSIVPEADTTIGFMWYPTEFVQIFAGYEAMGFLNTIASRRPIDFDYTNLNPHWSHTGRLYQGIKAGLALTF